MTNSTGDSLVVSYLHLRKAIGIIAVALPFVLSIGKIILEGHGIQSSISHYYYTDMRNVFVGCLFAIGIFLLSYRGYEWRDRLAGVFACICALGVALFPTTPEPIQLASHHQKLIGTLHFIFAGSLFLTLAYFALFLFKKGRPNPTPRKRMRNRVYTACGIIILLCIVAIAGVKTLLKDTPIIALHPIFWLESLAILAFGISWFTKGEGILKDL